MIGRILGGLLKRIGKFAFGIGISLFLLSIFVANMQADGIDTVLKQTISDAMDQDPTIITQMTQPPVDLSSKTPQELQTLKSQLLDQVSVNKMPSLKQLVDQLQEFKNYKTTLKTSGILLFLAGIVLLFISRGFNIIKALSLIGRHGAVSTALAAVFYKVIPILINNFSDKLISNGTAATGMMISTLLDVIIGKAVTAAFNVAIIGVVIFGVIYLGTLLFKGLNKKKKQ